MSSEAFIVALCERSSSTEASVLSLSCRRHAADEVGRVFLIRQPARGLRRSAALRQHEHRRTARVRIVERVGVDGDEQVGLRRARLLVALLASGMNTSLSRVTLAKKKKRKKSAALPEGARGQGRPVRLDPRRLVHQSGCARFVGVRAVAARRLVAGRALAGQPGKRGRPRRRRQACRTRTTPWPRCCWTCRRARP